MQVSSETRSILGADNISGFKTLEQSSSSQRTSLQQGSDKKLLNLWPRNARWQFLDPKTQLRRV